MLIILADMPSATRDEMVVWCACLATLAVFVVKVLQGVAAWKAIKAADKPLPIEQPLIIKHADVFVSKDDHKEFRQSVEDKLERIRAGQVEQASAAVKREHSIKSAHHRDCNNLKDALKEHVDDNLKEVFHRANDHGERIARLEQSAGIHPMPKD